MPMFQNLLQFGHCASKLSPKQKRIYRTFSSAGKRQNNQRSTPITFYFHGCQDGMLEKQGNEQCSEFTHSERGEQEFLAKNRRLLIQSRSCAISRYFSISPHELILYLSLEIAFHGGHKWRWPQANQPREGPIKSGPFPINCFFLVKFRGFRPWFTVLRSAAAENEEEYTSSKTQAERICNSKEINARSW